MTPSLDLTPLKSAATRDIEMASRATDGPWHTKDYESDTVSVIANGVPIVYDEGVPNDEDAAFIAHARLALPESAAAVLRLCAALEIAIRQRTHAYNGWGTTNSDTFNARANAEIASALEGNP